MAAKRMIQKTTPIATTGRRGNAIRVKRVGFVGKTLLISCPVMISIVTTVIRLRDSVEYLMRIKISSNLWEEIKQLGERKRVSWVSHKASQKK
jgi:hypothetical protein